MKLLAKAGIAVVFAASLIGCGEADPAALGSNTEASTEIPQLGSAYSLIVDSTVVTQHLETGETNSHDTRVMGIATVGQQGGYVKMKLYPCRIVLPKVGGFDPKIKDSTVRSLDPLTLEGGLIAGGAGSPARLETNEGVLLMGVRDLDDPFDDALPTDDGDPRVFDQDGDNAPGISVHFPLTRVFSVMRAVLSLSGDVSDDGETLGGDAELSVDGEVLGDSNLFIDARGQAAEAEGTTKVLSSHHAFAMERLYGSELRCSDVTD
jgi:hypothetical protein